MCAKCGDSLSLVPPERGLIKGTGQGKNKGGNSWHSFQLGQTGDGGRVTSRGQKVKQDLRNFVE